MHRGELERLVNLYLKSEKGNFSTKRREILCADGVQRGSFRGQETGRNGRGQVEKSKFPGSVQGRHRNLTMFVLASLRNEGLTHIVFL